MRSTSMLFTMLGISGLGLLGCGSSPTEVVVVNPTLTTLSIDQAALHDAALIVRATPEDASFVPSPSMRIRITISSTSGESKTIHVGPELCVLPSGREIVCNEFLVNMNPGSNVSTLQPYVEDIDARLVLTRVCTAEGTCEPAATDFGTVRIFDGELEAAMDEAQDWPGVRSVEYKAFLTVAATEANTARFAGGAPLSVRPPVPANTRVEVMTGDTLVVQYAQPNGDTLKASITM